ncbi:bacterial regulatory s, gntR family protein, partial [Vibrio parahaemolyticus V-223/04]
CHPVITS